MNKILSWFFILLGLFLLFVSTSKTAMKFISNKRNNDYGPFGTYHGHGDLGSMSFLSGLPKFSKNDLFTYARPADTTDRNLDLYLFGDSYTVSIPDSAYAHVAHFYSGRRDYTNLYYKLDAKKRNILIVENAERFARLWLKYTFIYNSVIRDTTDIPTSLRGSFSGQSVKEPGLGISLDNLFNPNINPNLEYNMFNYNIINPVREIKARLNYKFFHSASGDVAISDDGNQLFLKQTVAEKGDMSSFEKLDPRILNALTNTMTAIYKHYRKEGFDEVYFSVPPNPASILLPKYYNEFLPLLGKKLDSAGVPFIDDYYMFVNNPNKASLYFPNDTHWNGNGEGLWIKAVNEILTKESRKAIASPASY